MQNIWPSPKLESNRKQLVIKFRYHNHWAHSLYDLLASCESEFPYYSEIETFQDS